MKKRVFLVLILMISIVLTGCGKYTEKDLEKDLKKKIEGSKAYHLTGNLTMYSNEEKYKYDVEVSYSKDNNFRVKLLNKTNNHEQIILKNEEGVYVLTPSLKKSFKFQSEWPFNNSQSYILQSLLSDITTDKNKKFNKQKNSYILTTKVTYSNNKELTTQKITLDKKLNIKKVEVLNKEKEAQIIMKFNDIDMKATFDDDYFTLKTNMSTSYSSTEKETSKIEDVIYPMYIPVNTSLSSQEKVQKQDGERIIMTFSGEKPFTLVQETSESSDYYETLPVSGEPEIILDTIAAVSDSQITWNSNGIDYYLVSNSMDSNELVTVAKSINTLPVGK